MRILLKVLLLVLFAIVVFMPMRGIAVWLYWSLFLAMFLILVLYYRISYWVPVRDLPSGPHRFSLFAGKIPPMTSEDLVRGRLVVEEDRIVLYQRGGATGAAERVREVWSVPIEQIQGFSVGRVIGVRNGLILNLGEGQEARFAIFRMKRKKEALTRALGWAGQ
jgi:hypothetical protein